MLNFLANVFQNIITPKNTCDSSSSTIQGCIGCDSDCEYGCLAQCADMCQGETQATGGDKPGSCNSHCSGQCTSFESIMGIK